MSLVTPAEVKVKVKAGMTDDQLQAIIDNEESMMVARFGAHGDGVTPVTELAQRVGPNAYLGRRIVSVTTVTEAPYPGASAATLAAADYYTWLSQGRILLYPGVIISADVSNRLVTVTYVPADDRPLRKAVLIELVRIAVEQTAMRAESVAGEYSYQASDWDVSRARQYKRLSFFEV